jgi:hypothetical protein
LRRFDISRVAGDALGPRQHQHPFIMSATTAGATHKMPPTLALAKSA